MAKSRRVLRRKNKSRRRRGGMNAAVVPAGAAAPATNAAAIPVLGKPEPQLVNKVSLLIDEYGAEQVTSSLSEAIALRSAPPVPTTIEVAPTPEVTQSQ